MSALELDVDDVEKCTRLAEVLIPAGVTMPGIAALPSFAGLLRNAVRACGHADTTIRKALDDLPGIVDWHTVARHARDNPAQFRIASQLVSAAYYMAPQVLEGLSYPTDRRHPAREDEFADEFGTGVLDAVMARGPIFRDPHQ